MSIASFRRMHVRVDSRPDPRGIEAPERLRFGRRRVRVAETLDRWDGADHRYFKLSGSDGNLYIVRFDELRADWELIMFQRPRAAAAPPSSKRPLQRS